jgi:hypothetical protein
MSQTLWTLPVASTALLNGTTFQKLSRRVCALVCEYEDDSDSVVSIKLLFDGVEAFKCTYQGACTPEMIRNSYDKVVDVGSSEWLRSVQGQLISYGSQSVDELKHLMIYFDDGPCYEFICRAFRVEEAVSSSESV